MHPEVTTNIYEDNKTVSDLSTSDTISMHSKQRQNKTPPKH